MLAVTIEVTVKEQDRPDGGCDMKTAAQMKANAQLCDEYNSHQTYDIRHYSMQTKHEHALGCSMHHADGLIEHTAAHHAHQPGVSAEP